MTVIILVSVLFLALLAGALASVAGEDDHHLHVLHQRIERDQVLADAYAEFLKVHGRPPSTRELWNVSPPPEGK